MTAWTIHIQAPPLGVGMAPKTKRRAVRRRTMWEEQRAEMAASR
jgi:hypothetical protein